MASYLDELYAHQEWADAEHWRAFEAHPPHSMTKYPGTSAPYSFGAAWFRVGDECGKTGVRLQKLEDFPSMAELKKYGQDGLLHLNEFVKSLDAARAEEIIEVPWFRPPAKISIRQALTQAAMHSHYHRGQNATRFPSLGGVPPMTISSFGSQGTAVAAMELGGVAL